MTHKGAPCIAPAADILPSIGIIVVSKNRPTDIARCLASIDDQTTAPAQVIVVDQSSTRYTLAPRTSVQHIYDPQLRGIPDARNRAIPILSADIALFLDDDVELLPDCIEQLRRAVCRHPQAAGFQCHDLIEHYRGRIYPLLEAVFEQGFFNKSPCLTKGGPTRRWLEGYAMAMPARLLVLERFDDSLSGYALGEDWEMSQRLRRHGVLLDVPEARLYHHASPVNRFQMARIAEARWTNFRYFYDKLQADRDLRNRFYYIWWCIGESIRSLRAGRGLPFLTKHLDT
jgi:GT2 family glycosyltransferase